jgi:hypothetical protein
MYRICIEQSHLRGTNYSTFGRSGSNVIKKHLELFLNKQQQYYISKIKEHHFNQLWL